LTRIFSLGSKKYGVKITSEEIVKVGLFPKRMFIDRIEKISFEAIQAGYSWSYVYIITDNRGKCLSLPYSLLDGITFQELFRDLLKLSPKITPSVKLKEFLLEDITEKELKFDFEVHKGEFFKRNKELSQKYPSLDALIGLTIVFLILPIPFVFGGVGDYLLTQKFGDGYHLYRICSIVAGGLAFTVAITNLFISLASMYLGHKLTIISLIIIIIGLCVGFI
jgi:hypothetical protein